MKPYYDTIYLSPHLDDGALSCGGQIYQQTRQNLSVLVVTVMAGDPPGNPSGYARSLEERWELSIDASAARRAEDLRACQILGADALHWDVADCIYRTHPGTGEPLYLSDDHIFANVHQAEDGLVARVASQIDSLPACNHVVVPLTVGHHVDHQIVRSAAQHIFGNRVYFYEDYPYAQAKAKLERTLASETEKLLPSVVPLNHDALQAKVEAILAYRSQVSTFWKSRQEVEDEVFGYAKQVGGERLWKPALEKRVPFPAASSRNS